jgi:hypothetical protein
LMPAMKNWPTLKQTSFFPMLKQTMLPAKSREHYLWFHKK